MKFVKLTDAQADFVETVGRFWESVSLARTAGRILGWLMICEPAHQSAADLVGALDVSTGSVSTQVRHLGQLGLVERTTFPGDRASYYQLPEGVWVRTMEAELARMVQMRALAEAGSGVLPTTRPDRVTELGVIAEFFSEEWPGFLAKLSQRLTKVAT